MPVTRAVGHGVWGPLAFAFLTNVQNFQGEAALWVTVVLMSGFFERLGCIGPLARRQCTGAADCAHDGQQRGPAIRCRAASETGRVSSSRLIHRGDRMTEVSVRKHCPPWVM